MENKTTQTKPANANFTRRDIHQQVTDTIIQQLEAGTVPWHKPWRGDGNRLFALPENFTTGKKYRGINILLLWCAALERDFTNQEWASFKQWQDKKEFVRKGEKGTMIVYYDTLEREVDGEIKEIPFLKSSIVFNRSQLASYKPKEAANINETPLVQKIKKIDSFIEHTQAIVEHKGNRACYSPSQDTITMPELTAFIDTESCTATEGYYSTLFHELTHWTGNPKRLDRKGGKKFGDQDYAAEELVAELGAAFLCSEFAIATLPKGDHAGYIVSWLKVLKDNKHFIVAAASEASKAVGFLHELQPQ